jgi:anti-anti-sigma regulatory factor
MFKITFETEENEFRVKLHGNFTGEYVSAVEKALLPRGYNRNNVILDLRNVTLVDRAAMGLLRGPKLKNIKIRNTPSYVTRWIEQESS